MLKKLVTALQQDGTEVTAEEELAILNLKKSIEELTEAQDGSREKELELILAKEELIELEAEATAQSDKYHDAVREVEKAEEDLQKLLRIRRKLVKNRSKQRKILLKQQRSLLKSYSQKLLLLKN